MPKDWEVQPDGLVSRDSKSYAHEKLHYVGHYQAIFANAMKGKWRLVYLDLMAGPGHCEIDGKHYAGSPLRSLPPLQFSSRIFIDDNPVNSAALASRVGDHGIVLTDDCTSPTSVARMRKETEGYALGLAFVDNLGLDIGLESLRAITTDRRIDLVIVFQLQEITRNLSFVRSGDYDTDKWDRFFGTTEWRKIVSQLDILNTPNEAIAESLLTFYLTRLNSIGYEHTKPGVRVMKNEKNAKQYRLVLAGKHERAVDLFTKIEKIPYSGQRSFLD